MSRVSCNYVRGLRRAAACVRAGGIIAYPTEAVFGLGCSAYDDDAIARVIALKRRTRDKGLIVIAANPEQLRELIAPAARGDFEVQAELASAARRATTFVVPADRSASPLLCGGRATVAVRVCKHPVAQALCDYADGAIVSTSANRSGSQPARTALQARRWFLRQVDVLVGGRVGEDSRPSRIIDLNSGEVLRP